MLLKSGKFAFFFFSHTRFALAHDTAARAAVKGDPQGFSHSSYYTPGTLMHTHGVL